MVITLSNKCVKRSLGRKISPMKTLFKSTLIACASALALSSTASAQGLFNFEPAEGYFYTAGFVGVAVPDDIAGVELDSDVTYGGAVGGRLPFKSLGFIHTRLELEVSYFEAGIDVDEDFVADPDFFGSVGVAISDAPGASSVTNFSTTNSVGLTVPINQLDVYGEARYFKVYNEGPNLDGFNFTAGLRWKF